MMAFEILYRLLHFFRIVVECTKTEIAGMAQQFPDLICSMIMIND